MNAGFMKKIETRGTPRRGYLSVIRLSFLFFPIGGPPKVVPAVSYLRIYELESLGEETRHLALTTSIRCVLARAIKRRRPAKVGGLRERVK